LGISNKQKVLVTGGTGYLGARVGASLVAHGYDVYLGSRNPFSHGIVEGCNQVITNWDDPELTFCKGFDLIIHAAGMNACDCARDPHLAIEFNGKITERLAKKSASYGCKQFFYLSTVHVYRSPLSGRFNEQSPTLNTHPYAASHLFGEQALISGTKDSRMAGHVLRLSNCFGYPLTHENDCWGLVLNEFIRDAFALGRITIRGDFIGRRDFLPISELNNILIKILGITGLIPDIINVSTGTSRTLLDVALQVSHVVTEMTGKSVEIVKENISANGYSLNIENNSLQKMGIFPHKELTKEIRLMLEFLESHV
jgi:UDP-glucose 4-epimerase